MQSGSITMKIRMEILQKWAIELAYTAEILLLSNIQKKQYKCFKETYALPY